MLKSVKEEGLDLEELGNRIVLDQIAEIATHRVVSISIYFNN
jgi:hypothetical protein